MMRWENLGVPLSILRRDPKTHHRFRLVSPNTDDRVLRAIAGFRVIV